MRPLFVIFAQDPPLLGQIRGDDRQIVPTALAEQAGTGISHYTETIAAALRARSYGGGGVMLAIPSQWCMCAAIPIADLPKGNRRQLMIYRLEEQLPVAAEELVIDFSLAGERALGVCADVSRLRPWVDSLESQRVAVQSIVPIALLAAAGSAHSADILLLGESMGVEILTHDSGQVIGWTTEPDVEAVGIQLRRLALLASRPLSVVARGLDDKAIGALTNLTGIEISNAETANINIASNQRVYLTALTAAMPVLLGEKSPTVELRRDALAVAHPLRQIRGSLTGVLAAAIIFSLTLAGSLLLRADAYSRQAQSAEAAERLSYQDALGKPPIGANIKARLVSEDRRLRALSGDIGEASVLSGSRSALFLLSDTLKTLPTKLRYRLLDLQFSPEGLELNGQTRSHGDADAIAAGLRSVGYAVDPPHSEVRGQASGVDFTITARAIEPADSQRGVP